MDSDPKPVVWLYGHTGIQDKGTAPHRGSSCHGTFPVPVFSSLQLRGSDLTTFRVLQEPAHEEDDDTAPPPVCQLPVSCSFAVLISQRFVPFRSRYTKRTMTHCFHGFSAGPLFPGPGGFDCTVFRVLQGPVHEGIDGTATDSPPLSGVLPGTIPFLLPAASQLCASCSLVVMAGSRTIPVTSAESRVVISAGVPAGARRRPASPKRSG